jgi:hypothetical protein
MRGVAGLSLNPTAITESSLARNKAVSPLTLSHGTVSISHRRTDCVSLVKRVPQPANTTFFYIGFIDM